MGVSVQRREGREGWASLCGYWGWVSSREVVGGKATNKERKRVESHHLCREQKETGSVGKMLHHKAGDVQKELRG